MTIFEAKQETNYYHDVKELLIKIISKKVLISYRFVLATVL